MISFTQANRPLISILGTDSCALSTRSVSPRRLLSSSATLNQARERVRPLPAVIKPTRPCLGKDNPYLPADSLIGVNSSAVSIGGTRKYPIRIPRAAVDPKLLKSAPVSRPPSQAMDTNLKLRETGEKQVKKIVEDWVRNELNVMGTIRERTIQKFIQLLLNPSTLAPLAIALKLRTDGEKRPRKASLHAPARIVPAATFADMELTQLFYYFIGSLHRSLPQNSLTIPISPLLKKYVIELIKSGLPHTTPTKLLIRASQLSGQSVIGIKKGHAKAELRVAQLSLWGERRSKKLKKLVPDQKCHRNALNVRKAELLKQRWRDEELKMIHWRNRLLEVTTAQKIDAKAQKLERQYHSQEIKKWREEIQKSKLNPPINSGFFSKLFNFWRKPNLV
ncbi:hypothetical protein CROQUDRAFT_38221 [Cronartium quercuum f. sp. fusiforme G11]|uniref:Uncharacterized protein n=1 Tax=Cronartium quercuum f. sp. fusiforme G11 TaxID=708437 RepID=A0A9P6NU67_9BASI|nr:hypothetical protein CROQUDRAFT_38221 [Cronartium quercuum f. sp. fusiforme G11]